MVRNKVEVTKFMKKYLWLICISLFFNIKSKGQLLDDKPTQQLITKGLDALYNLDFSTSEQYFGQIDASYDKHPLKDLLRAFTLQWKYLPIDKNPVALKKYIAYLESSQLKAEILSKNPKYKAEAVFFLLASHGYIALSNNYQKEYTKAVVDANRAYGYLKDGFNYQEQNIEFNFTSGIYNFYRIKYPELHPIVKPFMLFFQDGNKQKGISQLKIAANRAIFSKVEATTYLTNIFIKYESNFQQALVYAQRLGRLYPNNFIFKIRYVETLLLNERFEEAKEHINFLSKIDNQICQLATNFFEGYFLEVYKKNDSEAFKKYMLALKYEANSRYTQEYAATSYLGLGRIMKRRGDKIKAKFYFNKCLENAEYQWVISKTKNELGNL